MSAFAAVPNDGPTNSGTPISRIDTGSSGFTAVNGNSAHVKPEQAAISQETGVTSRATPISYPSNAQPASLGWRPDTRASSPPQNEVSDVRKRKRSGSKGADSPRNRDGSPAQTDGKQSPKRRMRYIDSAIDLTSPETTVSPSAFAKSYGASAPPQIGVSSREPSPVRRSKDAGPVPPPRPEIEATLAESLQRELYSAQQQAQQQAQAQVEADAQAQAQAEAHERAAAAKAQAQAEAHAKSQYEAHARALAAEAHAHAQALKQAKAEAGSPAMDPYELSLSYSHQHDSLSCSPEQESGEYDPKKRKRNFSNRTKTGCHTCRRRKKKCDEAKPACSNCDRGGFTCEGYGAKPPGPKIASTATRHPVTLQSKPAYEASHGPSTFFQSPQEDQGRSYSHWGRIPTPQPLPVSEHRLSDPSPMNSIENRIPEPPQYFQNKPWPRPPAWPEPSPAYVPERLPMPDFSSIPPLRTYGPGNPPPPLPEPWGGSHTALTPYRAPTVPGAMMSSRASVTTSSSHLSGLSHNSTRELTEKDKMLRGRPFRAYEDSELTNDREQCRAALERYNDAAKVGSGISSEEKGRFFKAVYDPPFRPGWMERNRNVTYNGPKGQVGHRTLIETPFTCDYGYNIRVGDNVLIQSGCYMQDACEIHVGARTIIGHNVKFYGLTASVDKNKRSGVQGNFSAGAITIGDDCFIGGDVIIMPFRRIGHGATVGAGSVVTKDVKENTVVAGNPAKVIRRIESGPNVDRHHPEIQDQNDAMLSEMAELARHSYNDR